MTFKVPKFLKS